jgi:hypothetical protein
MWVAANASELIPIRSILVSMSDKGKAIWFLALLSPVLAELMSGSSPPMEFLNPFMFIGLLGMYGGGVLIIRELAIKWDKGWATIIVLGAMYAIIEEGLAVKSFFDPGWADLGDLDTYGRFWSTNWVWAVWLTIFHSTISISLPILIFGLVYPEFKQSRVLTDRQFRVVMTLFAADIVIFALVFSLSYAPPLVQYLLAIASVYVLFRVARLVPPTMVSARHEQPSWRPWKFFFLGLLLTVGGFLISTASYTRGLHPVWTIFLLLGLAAGILLLLQHKMGRTNNEPHKASFAAGLMALFMFIGILLEFDGVLGMSVVALIVMVFFFDLNRMVRGKSVLLFFRGRIRRKARLIM